MNTLLRERVNIVSWLLVAVVFILELKTADAVSVGLLYVVILLLGLSTPRVGDVFHVALLATGLSLFSYAVSPMAWDPSATMWNRGMELVVIWITAFGVNLHRRTLIARERAERHARESDARLREQEAMARIGKMTTIVAHEVRNPLAAIRGAVQMISNRLDPSGVERSVANEIVARVDAMNHQITTLLQFSHREGAPDEWWEHVRRQNHDA